MKKIVFVLLLVSAGTISVYAQSIGPSTLNATGGYAVLGSNEFEWSVGEMTMVSTFSSSSIVITQGVLQPVPSTEGVPNVTSISQQLRVFPNPTSSVVNIEYASKAKGTLTYRIFDMLGRSIKTKTTDIKAELTTVQVDISELACAGYMLEVVINSGIEQTGKASFNIQKVK